MNSIKLVIYNLVFVTTLVCLTTVLPGSATPIKPTAEQLLQEQQRPVMPYIPAQAGWNGPATQSQADAAGLESFNTEEILRNAELARQHRALLMHVATPDPRVLVGFALIILLLRKLRTLRETGGVPAPQPAKA